MIQTEYLINGLRIDVIQNKLFTEQQKIELFEILYTCPSIPMSLNIIKVTKAGEIVKHHLNTYEEKYLSFGGDPEALKTIKKDYERVIVSALKGFKHLRD